MGREAEEDGVCEDREAGAVTAAVLGRTDDEPDFSDSGERKR